MEKEKKKLITIIFIPSMLHIIWSERSDVIHKKRERSTDVYLDDQICLGFMEEAQLSKHCEQLIIISGIDDYRTLSLLVLCQDGSFYLPLFTLVNMGKQSLRRDGNFYPLLPILVNTDITHIDQI